MLITHDLEMEILSFADSVTVIFPKSLIKEVQQRHENAFKQYQKK